MLITLLQDLADIMMQLDSSRSNKIAENKRKLVLIFETIILCGRQELALRATSEYGPITLYQHTHNDQNFSALLLIRLSSRDTNLITFKDNRSMQCT